MDILSGDIPVKLITGMVIMHADKYASLRVVGEMAHSSETAGQSNADKYRSIHCAAVSNSEQGMDLLR